VETGREHLLKAAETQAYGHQVFEDDAAKLKRLQQLCEEIEEARRRT
jgi:hypothetical protein